MMDPDDYLAAIDRFAAEMAERPEGFELYFHGLQETSPEAEACVDFRAEIATAAELKAVAGYLEIGYFGGADEARRKVWWLFLFDITRASDLVRLRRTCARYDRSQPLFAGAPGLFEAIRRRQGAGSPDYELIDETRVDCVDDSEIYRVPGGFGKLAPELASQITAWARERFPAAPRFVRLDPWSFSVDEPLRRLTEAALVPADPRWMATLALFPNTKTFAAYALEDCDPKLDMDQYRDFHLRGIRRLEVTAQRREPDYLTMMIEELPRAEDANGLMVGRCIHLDTRAIAGTPMRDARLQHLDLAVNVYQGADRATRYADSLQNGKVVDATFRTHLFRVEDVPFPALFGFAQMFLKSQMLFREWTTDLFPEH